MRRKLLTVITLLAATFASAAPVTPEQAQQQAQQFMNRRAAASGRHLAPGQQQLAPAATPFGARYYAFNATGGQGFVIVSGDDATQPILGYSDSGTFQADQLPDNMRAWLEGYDAQLRYLELHPAQARQAAPTSVKEAIQPMLTTLWNQGDPFNRLCPMFLTSSDRCVTGCVATAMAQVLYYHASRTGLPAGTTKDIAAYDCSTNWKNYGYIHVDAKPAINFDWEHMLPHYNFSSATLDGYATECTAVAQLMAWCGASVGMNYANARNGGSSAPTSRVAAVLPEYFDCEASYVSRDDYTYAAWQSLVYSELTAGRPVLYSGQSSGGGHAFVVDGYDGDGLYHVNWGWGGGSNGYFQLSILNSDDHSGIGASSSRDGYSFGQEAVIGIQPATGATPEEPGAQMTPRNIALSGATVTFAAWNWSGAKNTFDLGVGYVDESGTISDVVTIITGRTYDVNYGGNSFTATIDGSSRPAGSYKLVVTSKTSDSDTWLTKMNPMKDYIEAVFDGAGGVTLILHPLPVSLAVSDIAFTGNKKSGVDQTADVTVTNNSEEFYGELFLFASQTTNKGSYASLCGVTIEAGATITTQLSFKPTATGTWTVWVATDSSGSDVIGTATVDITAEGIDLGYTDNIDLTATLSVLNADGSYLIGNTAQTHITVTNPGTQTYQGRIYLMRWLWVKASGGGYNATGGYTSKEVTIPAGESVEFDLESLTMSGAEYYSVAVYQTLNGSRQQSSLADSSWYTLTDGYATYAADGTKTVQRAQPTISIPADALFVDLRGQSVVESIGTPSNPNTLIAVDPGSALSSLGTNVIVGTEADAVELYDGYDFYVPFAFTARTISYHRTFAKGYRPGAYGWETIMLPFAVTTVATADEGQPIDWFRSAFDTGKQFWVMEFSGDDNTQVYFTQAAEMKAYKPYLVAVPGSSYPSNDLTGRDIVFTGTDASLLPSADIYPQVGGSVHKFVGVQTGATLDDIYKLDDEGHQFVSTSSAVSAFHAYFKGRSGVAALGIGIGGGATAINAVSHADASAGQRVYDLQGRPVVQPAKGLYIVGGKKVVIK